MTTLKARIDVKNERLKLLKETRKANTKHDRKCTSSPETGFRSTAHGCLWDVHRSQSDDVGGI